MTAVPFANLAEFANALRPGAALIGLDPGEKTIGIAVSDTRRSIATALETITRGKFTRDAERILTIIRQRAIGGIVFGLPLNMDGSEGPRCQAARAMARNLAALTPLPMTFQDERLTSVEAERAMLEADLSRRKRAARIDHVAASYILQTTLDRLAYLDRTDAQ
jgi:putative holliday junction resolvase